MLSLIFANADIIATIYCSWENDGKDLKYKIIEASDFKKNPQQTYTFNSAVAHIVDMFEKYPKGIFVGLGWPSYGGCMSPMQKLKYRTVFDLRNIAVATVTGTREFYTDKKMERYEQGDESLDKVTMLQPLSL